MTRVEAKILQLLDKLEGEWLEYKGHICDLSPEEIFEDSYGITARTLIYSAIREHLEYSRNLNVVMLVSLEMENALSQIYEEWLGTDYTLSPEDMKGFMDYLCKVEVSE